MDERSACAVFAGNSARAATYAFIDVETTGIDPRSDCVVEVACITVRRGIRLTTFCSLVDPGRAIPATAAAIHQITDREVAGAPTLAMLRPHLEALCTDAVIVAHNARFDLAFLPFLAHRPAICSLRLARRVVPDAPSYKNAVLRYHLDLGDAVPAGTAAHRALNDAVVTSRIFAICLERYVATAPSDDIEAFVAAAAAPRRIPGIGRSGVGRSAARRSRSRWSAA